LKTKIKIASVKKTFGIWLLALFVLGFTGAIASLRAQDQAAEPQKQESSTPEKRERPDGRHNQSFGRQLARETREAAGEEEEKDDTAEFKQSPSVRLIAKWTGLSLEHAYWLAVIANFFVIGVVIFWAARKYLPPAFSARTAAIQKAMQEAQKASEDARRRLAEIESRLRKLDVEIGMMRDSAEKEAAAEEARIQAAAQEDARKLVESAQQEIAVAAKAARRKLTAYAADLAVNLAQKQVHVDAATDKVLVRNFSAQLGTSSSDSSNGPGKGNR
jgi:F-type H+-transporting ATPase subunit b